MEGEISAHSNKNVLTNISNKVVNESSVVLTSFLSAVQCRRCEQLLMGRSTTNGIEVC